MSSLDSKKETFLPKIKPESLYYSKHNILIRNKLPINVCDALNNNLKKFKHIFSIIQKNKILNKKKFLNNIDLNLSVDKSNSNKKRETLNTNNITTSIKNNIINNTQTELKMNKIIEKFNTDKNSQKNYAYDLIKGRMFNKLKNYYVKTIQDFSTALENNNDFGFVKTQREYTYQKKIDLLSKKKVNIITDRSSSVMQSEKITRRFEDIYLTPDEFLHNNFTKDEIDLMIKNANYFKLNKKPLKDWDLKINFTLKDTLNKEEEKSTKKIKLKTENNLNTFNNFTKAKINNYRTKPNIIIMNRNNKHLLKTKLKIRDTQKTHIISLNKEKNKVELKKNLKNGYNENNEKIENNELSDYKHCKIIKTSPRVKKNARINYNTFLKNNTNYSFGNKTSYNKPMRVNKNEVNELTNILNTIKGNYMKKNHENLEKLNNENHNIENKIKFSNLLSENKKKERKRKRRRSSILFNVVRIGDTLLSLSSRLWK